MRIRTLVSAAAMLALSAGALANPLETFNFFTLNPTIPSASSVAGSGQTFAQATTTITVPVVSSGTTQRLKLSGTLTVTPSGTTGGTLASEARIYVIPPVGTAQVITTPTAFGAFANVTTNIPSPYFTPSNGNWDFKFYESFQDSPVNTADAEWTNLSVVFDDGVITPPAFAHDFGSLDPTQTSQAFASSVALTIPQNGVQWCKFILGGSGVSNAARSWLDIDTETSALTPANDTKLGLYNGTTGALVGTAELDDGTDLLSQISYGFTLGRAAPGNGLAYNGRDGTTLAADTYYIAVVGDGTTTFGAEYAVTTTAGTNTGGTAVVNIRAGTTPLVAPSTFHDFGTVDQTLPTPGSLTFAASSALTIPTNGVAWAKFVLPAPGIAAASRSWLDIDTEGSALTPNDTKLGLYNGTTGVLVGTAELDDGTDLLSQISYGLTSGRPAPGNGLAYNGRDGTTLAANTYYIAVTGNGTTTFGADFNPTTTGGTTTGTAVIRLRTGTTPVPYPGTFTDLGNITVVGAGSSASSAAIPLAANGVAWFKFNLLTGVDKAALSYLDIDTEGSVLANANDTRMGVYDNTGNYLSLSDDNDGTFLLSQMTFGRQSRPVLGTVPNASLPYNGRDGTTRAAGTYWVAVTGQGTTTYGTTDYNVTSTSANTGTVKLNVRAGTYADATPEQIGPVTDLGTISTCPTNFAGTLAPGEVKWYKFFLPVAVNTTENNWLDIDTEGSALTPAGGSNDTYIGLYTAAGARVAIDDDDGTAVLSQLSFGENVLPHRVYPGTVGGDGRDGFLAVGTYYFAAAAFTTTMNATAFDVVSSSARYGPWQVHILYGDNDIPPALEPTGAATLGTFDPASFGPGGGASATSTDTTNISGPGLFKWYKVILSSDVSSANRTWLDIDTETSTIAGLATSISLYSAVTGDPVASDNNDGSGSLSQLTFGVGGLGARAAVGDGLTYNGRDGSLVAGTYYLAVTPNPGAFGNDYAVQNCGSALGDITVNAKTGYTPIIFPTLAHTFAAFSAPTTCQVFAASSPGEALSVGGVNWYKITVPAIDNASGTYCDISTNGSTLDTNSWEPGFIDDTLMAIYSAAGAGLFADDDTGQDNGSAFSFGANTPSRVNGVNGAPLVGQTAAALAAGDYYIAVIEYDDLAVFAGDFGVSAGPGHVGGTTRLNVTVGKNAGSATSSSGDPTGISTALPLIADNAWHASAPVAVSATGVVWLTFTAPDFSVARTYLDFDMEGTTVTNMALAVFTSAGAIEDNDTLDGTADLPQLSYGFTLGRPGPGGGALSYNGRDGTLTAGATYFLAVIAEPNDGNDTFALNWGITTPASCTTPSGNAIFRYRTGVQPPAAPPVADADLGTISACGPTNVSTALMTINGANPMFRWVKFTTAAAISTPSFIDIHTIGSTIVSTGTFQDDTEIGLYDSTGASIANNDQAGLGGVAPTTNLSALSYGSTDGTGRTYAPFTSPCIGGTGATLAAGTYYIAIGQWNIDFNGEFTPVVTTGDEAGSVKINIVANVGAPCPTIGTDNANQTVACNGTANFTITLNDAGAATYQWRKNGVALVNGATPSGAIISGATTATLTITGARNSESNDLATTPTFYTYDCVVTTNNPCCPATITSATATLDVTPVCKCNDADVSLLGQVIGSDGRNTVDDLVVFLNEFFANNAAVADVCTPGESFPNGTPDTAVTVDDLIYFLQAFFAPCENP